MSKSDMGSVRRLATSGPFHWIRGARVEGSGNTFMDNVEPRSGSILSQIRIASQEDVNEAVKAAKEAFPTWKSLPSMERGNILRKTAGILRERIEEIAMMDVIDNGKPIWEARLDMESVLGALEYYGAYANNGFQGEYYKLPGGSFAYVTKEPIGLVAGIGAWNYPLQTATWKVAPALASGNTFIYKPSQFTPLTVLYLAEALKEAGLPDGVFNILQGEGETGSLLCSHPEVSKLSFTGSVTTGTKIMKAGAEGIRHVTLELGGKSPLIIFEDADLKNAVKGALMANSSLRDRSALMELGSLFRRVYMISS
uniref:4-trimethylaminobutyraldehyde dehydrogenase n=1 Tax=Caligus clemensi TaxID=344056 RepID=C1C1Z2_CALCM|nr:4-trimethylaminobutyraldehyde dehydrogenase [Caligus clemensi]